MSSTKYLLALLLFLCNYNGFGQYKDMSVLASGDIFKFSVTSTGIYKMDYAYLSSIEGLNINQVDPRNLHIYSNRGGLIPQENEIERIDDLAELPLYIKGGEDGSFDSGDYLLVYLEGADKYNISGSNIRFEKNIYDSKNYFFLKADNMPGLRIESKARVNPASFENSTESVKRHETDIVNLLGNFGGTQGTGKRWFGEAFTNEPIQSFSSDFTFPNLVSGTTADLEILMCSRSLSTSSYTITVDGEEFGRNMSSTNTGDIEALYARFGFLRETTNLSSSTPEVVVEYKPNTSNSEAWLDYIQLVAQEYLVYDRSPLFFFRRDSRLEDLFGYSIASDRDLTVWNVSNLADVHAIETDFNNNNVNFGFETNSETQLFMAFEPDQITSRPEFEEKIANQNLHAIERADFIIVYHNDFRQAAERLAEHRRSLDQLEIQIVDIHDIYNEFGSGKNDPVALRDFVRMVYDRDPNFRYLLLFGDGSYDYRGITNGLQQQNFVPTYQTDESLHPIEGFPSDDFFALLSEDEGDDSLNGDLDIGVGRIPCKTLLEANNVVDKIINYDTNKNTLGEWRTRIGFAADDEDFNAHMAQADGIARLTEGNHPELVQQKVYFDAFNQESTPGGDRYPDASRNISENLSNGQLVLNYLGHGGPKGWAQERVFQIEDINSLNNYDRLPVLITATCSFTGFDDPSIVTAGEQALLNPKGGAIALFSTVRAVFSSQNERITREVFKKIFSRPGGERLRLGDIIMESQNANVLDQTSDNTRKFMLFGDPSQTLALPRHKVTVDSFNGLEPDTARMDTLGALSKAKITGHIENYLGDKLNDFNGEIFITVFDKQSRIETLSNDNNGNSFKFNSRKNILYKGSATVTAGQYEIEFIIPIDINFEVGQGFISLYASDGLSKDASGFYDQFNIGGVNEEGIADNEGPQIDIYLNNRSFKEDDIVGTNSILLVDLEDENGINLSSTSIGHDITGVIDGNSDNPIVLNGFFSPASDKLGSGTVRYNLNGLQPGRHSITIKAWDILNNSSEASTYFYVGDPEEGFIRNVFNYPNPVKDETTFSFEHDLINNNLDIEIAIFSLDGKLVDMITSSIFASNSTVDNIMWNNNNKQLERIANGIYIYKIKVYANELNLSRESKFHKLVIFN